MSTPNQSEIRLGIKCQQKFELIPFISYENEDEVGSALKVWLAANPTFKRSDIFITTKVWPHLMEPEEVEWSLTNSLENLGVDYVDAFLIHWPFACERTEDRRVKLGNDGKVYFAILLCLSRYFLFSHLKRYRAEVTNKI